MRTSFYFAVSFVSLIISCAEKEHGLLNSASTTSTQPPVTSRGIYSAPPNCPDNYVAVAGDPAAVGHDGRSGVPGFCISRYEMKHPDDINGRFIVGSAWNGRWTWSPDISAIPQSKSVGRPWVLISYPEAHDACLRVQGSGFSYSLPTNLEWDVLTNNISRTPENWSELRVGEGVLARGFRILDRNNWDTAAIVRNHSCAWSGDPSGFCPAPLPVSQIWNHHSDLTTSIGTPGIESFQQRRTHILSNGQTIWDLGGNVSEWVIHPSENGTGSARGGHFGDVTTDIFTRVEVADLPNSVARRLNASPQRQTTVGFRCAAHPIR